MMFLLAAPVWGLFLYAVGFGLRMYLGDLLSFFWRRKSPASPDWTHLQEGNIRRATEEKIKKQKEHLQWSCQVRGFHTQRNSHMGLISHPLEMDEESPLFRHPRD